jgi:hypothetical protein
MFEKLRKNLVSILVIITVLSLAANASIVHADKGDVEFYVNPADNSFNTNTTPVGTRFNITVMWKDSGTPLNNVYAWQVNLRINTTMLNCTRAWAPTWDPDYLLYPRKPDWLHPAASGLGTNEITVMGSLQSPATAVQDDSAKLTICELEIMKAPPVGGELSSALNINNVDTIWSPDGLLWNDPIKTDGHYLYSSAWTPPPPAMISVDPSSVMNRSLTSGDNVTVSMKILGATSVYQFDFKLGFNNTVLSVVEATLGSFFPSSVVPTVMINNAAGFVQVSASLSPPETPKNGSGTLAAIKLQVQDVGISSLHLYDVLLKDDSGHTLPANTTDGNFNNAAILGDVTGPGDVPDGKVDVRDIALVGSCLGSYPGHGRYDSRADINGDRKINIIDIALAMRNYGQPR